VRLGLVAMGSLLCAGLYGDDADFVTAVNSTKPVAYYRLDSTAGKSLAGVSQYKTSGGVMSSGPGAPIGVPNNQFAKLDGKDGYIVTTQAGGVNGAASIMAWVNLDSLPSDEHRFFYVAGESENGNDLDVQFENDNQLKFYTAAGGHLTYIPEPTTLVHQWHMLVATMETATQTRVIYWDGKAVANDKGGGQADKKGLFSIGASTVFGGRFFKGGIEEVALWNRALKPAEVASIYAASKSTASPAKAVGAVKTAPAIGAFATTAIVEAEDGSGPMKLKREEQIALMFLTAIQEIESECQMRAKAACSMEQMLAGPVAPDGSHLSRLKFDPKSDPNYTYTLGAVGMAWEAHANAKKPGLLGLYFLSKSIAGPDVSYNPSGTASPIDKQFTGRSIAGDSFATR
jgi:hypothetical protein